MCKINPRIDKSNQHIFPFQGKPLCRLHLRCTDRLYRRRVHQPKTFRNPVIPDLEQYIPRKQLSLRIICAPVSNQKLTVDNRHTIRLQLRHHTAQVIIVLDQEIQHILVIDICRTSRIILTLIHPLLSQKKTPSV